MKYELVQPIRGIVPPLVTPLTDDGLLDVEGLGRLIEHVLEGGVHGIFLLGTTGEGPSLSGELQREVIRQACKAVDRRVPLLAGISHSCLADSLALANFAAEEGCDAVVATPAYYFPQSQDDVLAYFRTLIAQLPLPLMLYNMPAVAGSTIEFETARQLAEEEAVVGVKDSSGDLEGFRQYVQLTQGRPDFSLLVGPEQLLSETLAMGGTGGVSGGANVWPRLFVQLYEASLDNDQPTVERLHELVEQLGAIYTVGPVSIPTIVARTKAALSIRNICNDATAPPLNRASEAEQAAIREILQRLPLTEEQLAKDGESWDRAVS